MRRPRREGVQELPGFAATGEAIGLLPAPSGNGVRAPLPEPSAPDLDSLAEEDAALCRAAGFGSPETQAKGEEGHGLTTDGTPTGAAPTPPPPKPPPLVAVSDGSQDAEGFAVLSGLPLPAGVKLRDQGDGWIQGGIEACAECKHGTIWRNPAGVPMHRTCAEVLCRLAERAGNGEAR